MSNEEKKKLMLEVIESALNSLREIGENYEIREVKPVNSEK